MKASHIKYAAAKRIALTTLIKQPPDTPIPDAIRFENDEIAFAIRLRHGDRMIEKFVAWSVVDTSVESIVHTMKLALADLARAQ